MNPSTPDDALDRVRAEKIVQQKIDMRMAIVSKIVEKVLLEFPDADPAKKDEARVFALQIAELAIQDALDGGEELLPERVASTETEATDTPQTYLEHISRQMK